jgi:hypothetical protein
MHQGTKSIMRLAGALAAVTIFVCVASAQPITYVDATHGPTGNTQKIDWNVATQSWDATVWTPTADNDQWTPNDGVWTPRTVFGNGGRLYQNFASGQEDDAHALLTTISGLPQSTYNVYVYYWSDSSLAWRIRASLTGGEGPWPLFVTSGDGIVQHYIGGDATVMSDSLGANSPFDNNVMLAEGNRRLFQAYLGQVTGSGFSVFINDGPDVNRTWYDGVGYSAIPEPSTYALFLGLGVLGFLAIRRRARRE